jgi:thioredoxin 1
MAENVQEVTDADFEQEVLQADGPVMVDMWAPWCGPCRRVAPVVADLAEENAEKIKVCKLNVDENQKYAAEFGVSSIPTVMFFKDGEELTDQRLVGALPKSQYQDVIDSVTS